LSKHAEKTLSEWLDNVLNTPNPRGVTVIQLDTENISSLKMGIKALETSVARLTEENKKLSDDVIYLKELNYGLEFSCEQTEEKLRMCNIDLKEAKMGGAGVNKK
jgi:predicted RNase H-like nuclease (RuvC/YqgF family)